MSWRVLKLNVYWSAEEADTVLTFIDELRDQIIHTYGEQIISMRTEELDTEVVQSDKQQTELDLEGF